MSEELAGLRAACDAVVATLLESDPERIVVIGAGELPADLDQSAGGTLAAYGADVTAGGPGRELPLSLTIGAWLLDRAGWAGPRTYSTGRPATDGRVALLVMADGCATRSTAAPGFLDERAEAFDASIAAALADGDGDALVALDSELGAELLVAGTEPLRTLGRWVSRERARGASVDAHLRVDVAPLGVGYWVADWVFGWD